MLKLLMFTGLQEPEKATRLVMVKDDFDSELREPEGAQKRPIVSG